MFGVIPLTIVWFLAFLFALRQRSKYSALAQNATEQEEIIALNKIIDKHTFRASIYGVIFAFFLIMCLAIFTAV
jgi:hypothetical protein